MFDMFNDNTNTTKYHPCCFCSGEGKETCSKCKGKGKIEQDKICPKCKGKGKVTCPMCNGEKKIPEW